MYYYILAAMVTNVFDTFCWVKHECVTTCNIFLLVTHCTLVTCCSFCNILMICADIFNFKMEYMEVSVSSEGAYDYDLNDCIISQTLKRLKGEKATPVNLDTLLQSVKR